MLVRMGGEHRAQELRDHLEERDRGALDDPGAVEAVVAREQQRDRFVAVGGADRDLDELQDPAAEIRLGLDSPTSAFEVSLGCAQDDC